MRPVGSPYSARATGPCGRSRPCGGGGWSSMSVWKPPCTKTASPCRSQAGARAVSRTTRSRRAASSCSTVACTTGSGRIGWPASMRASLRSWLPSRNRPRLLVDQAEHDAEGAGAVRAMVGQVAELQRRSGRSPRRRRRRRRRRAHRPPRGCGRPGEWRASSFCREALAERGRRRQPRAREPRGHRVKEARSGLCPETRQGALPPGPPAKAQPLQSIRLEWLGGRGPAPPLRCRNGDRRSDTAVAVQVPSRPTIPSEGFQGLCPWRGSNGAAPLGGVSGAKPLALPHSLDCPAAGRISVPSTKLNSRSLPSRKTRAPRGKSRMMAGSRTSRPPV